MTHPLSPDALVRLPALLRLGCVAALLLLAGCVCNDKPCTNEDLVLSAPTYTSAFYPSCHGRSVRVTAHVKPHGSRLESLGVLITNVDGAPQTEAPEVRLLSGARLQTQTTENGATILWFEPPGPCDGTCLIMQVTVSCSDRCPYRVRLVPVFKAG